VVTESLTSAVLGSSFLVVGFHRIRVDRIYGIYGIDGISEVWEATSDS